MQTTPKTTRNYWATPILSVVIGVVYLIAFTVGGHLGEGLAGLGVMVVAAVVLALAGRRSETIRGLLDRRDERISGIDLRATAITGLVLIVAILVGFVAEVARGRSGWPYDMLGAVGGVGYVLSVIFFRLRG